MDRKTSSHLPRLVALGGLALAVVTGGYQWRLDDQARAAALTFQSQRLTAAIEHELLDALDTVAVVQAFAKATSVTDDSFVTFAEPIVAREPALRALGSNAIVSREDLPAFEARFQAAIPTFRVWERRDGAPASVGDRPVYAPVDHIAPLAGNEAALGFDIASEPVRAEAMGRAQSTGELALTGPLVLVQEPGEHLGFLALMPGEGSLVAGVFRIPDILEAALTPLAPIGLEVGLHDEGSPGESYLWRSPEEGAVRLSAGGAPPVGARSGGFTVGGRTWRLDYTPAPVRLADRLLLPLGVFTVVIALTALATRLRRQQEDGRRALEEEARRLRAERMESLGTLAGGIAHDFNNLLTPVLLSAEVLAEDLEDPEDREAAAMIREAASTAAHLTRQMLDYVGRNPVQVRLLDLGSTIRGIEGLLRATVPGRLALSVQVDEGLPAIEGNPSQLEQVVLNLVTNAVEAQPSTGRVSVRSGQGRPTGRFVVGEPFEGPAVFVEVADAGPGIPDPVEKMFEPFNSTRALGRGLGLAVVQGVARSLGGAVTVQTSDAGTSIRLWVPASGEAPPEPLTAPGTASSPHAERVCRVLIADDDPWVRASTAQVLTRAGHAVDEVGNGVDAVERAGTVDVVLLDVDMPRMSGIEAAVKIRASHPHVRVVLVSGYPERTWAGQLEGLDLTVTVKPVSPRRLRELVEQD